MTVNLSKLFTTGAEINYFGDNYQYFKPIALVTFSKQVV